MGRPTLTLHQLLDTHYGRDGAVALRTMLREGHDPEARVGPNAETALHVAVRRRRAGAVGILLDHGADIDARTAGGKTGYAHAARRGFGDVTGVLLARGASTELNDADRLAVALVNGDIDAALAILAQTPGSARTGNPEEDRILADLAGRPETGPVRLLVDAGADLTATGLDSGTPLHQAAWFGEPANARILIDAGAALDVFDATHHSSPLGWAVHGSRFSGDAEIRQDRYVQLVRMLLEAGSSLVYPRDSNGDAYYERLLRDATEPVAAILRGTR